MGQIEEGSLPSGDKLSDMSRTERLPFHGAVIEFAGTPYPHKADQFLHNCMEDVVAVRYGAKPYTLTGIEPNASDDVMSFMASRTAMELRLFSFLQRDLALISGGPFQAMAEVEFFRRRGDIPSWEASAIQDFLLTLVAKESAVIVTRIRPRAAMSTHSMASFLDTETFHGLQYGYYDVFNDCVDEVLDRYAEFLNHVYVVDIPGDEFDRVGIVVKSGGMMLEILQSEALKWDRMRNSWTRRNV